MVGYPHILLFCCSPLKVDSLHDRLLSTWRIVTHPTSIETGNLQLLLFGKLAVSRVINVFPGFTYQSFFAASICIFSPDFALHISPGTSLRHASTCRTRLLGDQLPMSVSPAIRYIIWNFVKNASQTSGITMSCSSGLVQNLCRIFVIVFALSKHACPWSFPLKMIVFMVFSVIESLLWSY